jgi:hypothetical protein
MAPLYPQTLALTSPTSGDRSVGIVRSQTQATEFGFFLVSRPVCLGAGIPYDWFMINYSAYNISPRTEKAVPLPLLLDRFLAAAVVSGGW